MYRYYLLLRPVGIGTQPQGMADWHNFDSRKYISEIDHEAWGWVEYDQPLSQEEIDAYDMKGVIDESMKLKSILSKCSFPIWVNVETLDKTWTYGLLNGDEAQLEVLRNYEVTYITADCDGNLVIELKEEE